MTLDRNGTKATGTGRIELQWLPSPAIRWNAEGMAVHPALGAVTLCVPSIPNPIRGQLTNFQSSVGPSASLTTVSGYIENGEGLHYGGSLRAVIFHLANFIPFLGAPARDDTGTTAARATLRADGWVLTLDRIPDSPGGSRHGLQDRAGYSISHVGQLERENHDAFTIPAAKRVLDELYWFFSFCRGKPTPPILPVGLNNQLEPVWSEWANWNVAPDRAGRNWFNDLSAEGLEKLYPGFVKRSHDGLWSDRARNAIYWYLEAGRLGNDSAIILLQAAFELIAWTLLVDEQRLLTKTKFKKLRASKSTRSGYEVGASRSSRSRGS